MIKKLKVLKLIADEFNKNEIHYALGASVLLFFKGIVDEFHDIDIEVTIDDSQKAIDILKNLGAIDHTSSNVNKYGTKVFKEYFLNEVDIDLMAGMIIRKDNRDYDCALNYDDINEFYELDGIRIPLDTLNNWRKYYDLIGNRQYKVDLIDEYNKKHIL